MIYWCNKEILFEFECSTEESISRDTYIGAVQKSLEDGL